jgi:exopolysaccharide biosynthesis polyprenyl glycosylphosphotransferase
MEPIAQASFTPAIELRAPAPAAWPRDRPGHRTVLRRDAALRRLLAFADLLASAVGLLLATELAASDRPRWWLPLAFLFVVPLGKVAGLYHRDELLLRKSTLDEIPLLFRFATVYTLLVGLLAPTLMANGLDEEQALVLWGTLLACLVLLRAATRRLFIRFAAAERCMVVGDAPACERIESKLAGSHNIGAEIVLALPFDTREGEAAEMAELALAGRLGELIASHHLQRIIIAPHDSDADHIRQLVQVSDGLGLHVSIVPRILEMIGSSVEFDDVSGLPVLGVQRFGLNRSSAVIKRAFDLVGSLAGLIAVAPLLAVIALAIKLDSVGSIFFSQLRVGQNGRVFRMLKFRTMVDGAEERKQELMELNESDGLFKIADDPRITRVGRLLRRLSIDELPQLINVVRGEMSLVGPRPLVLEEDQRVEGWHRQRLSLTPGMTGHWQILGSARIPLGEMVKIDYLYVTTWSLWSDVKILLRTAVYVLGRRGM